VVVMVTGYSVKTVSVRRVPGSIDAFGPRGVLLVLIAGAVGDCCRRIALFLLLLILLVLLILLILLVLLILLLLTLLLALLLQLLVLLLVGEAVRCCNRKHFYVKTKRIFESEVVTRNICFMTKKRIGCT